VHTWRSGDAAVPSRGAWGFWATLAWFSVCLAAWWGFSPLEHALLDGTALGRLIGTNFALGALNVLVGFAVPLLVLVAAVRMRGSSVRDYFGWLRPRGADVLLGIALALALQFVYYAFFYVAGADITGAAIAQWREEAAAGTPHWWPLLLLWPSVLCAPLVEESVFRGFLWRGWAQSPLGPAATWLLTSVVFAAFHIPILMERGAVGAGVALVQDFLLGLAFGWVRWRGGTSTASMPGHMAGNLVSPLYAFAVGAMFAGPL
jgi:membrane protease YdiL (CAAX protease family)